MKENTQQTIFMEFTVEDTGKGLSKRELRQLFKKFTQASPKTYGRYGGSGLGLYISRELVELHGGQIGVSSEEGHGATLFFYIKAERILTPPLGTKLVRKPSLTELLSVFKNRKGSMDRATTSMKMGRATPSPKEEKQIEFPGVGMRTLSDRYEFESVRPPDAGGLGMDDQPIYVLLVEDNMINQRILAQQLTKQGLTVSVADNGLEAVQFVRQSDYASWPAWSSAVSRATSEAASGSDDGPPKSVPENPLERAFLIPKPLTVVLMDIEMPVMNGLTATSRIREFERDGTLVGHIPIIAVTANARPENVQAALDAGMDDVLTKPFRITQLLDKIKECMEKVGGKPSAVGGFTMM